MFCTQLKRLYFAVYFGKNVPLYVELVTFEENFWQQNLPGIEFSFKKSSGFVQKSNDINSKKQVAVFGEDSDDEEEQPQHQPGKLGPSAGWLPVARCCSIFSCQEIKMY